MAIFVIILVPFSLTHTLSAVQQQRLHYSADVYIIPVKWETGADQQQSRTTEEELEKH